MRESDGARGGCRAGGEGREEAGIQIGQMVVSVAEERVAQKAAKAVVGPREACEYERETRT